MDLVQALAIIWNIQPAATISANYITGCMRSGTTCKA